jgi:hypothetical protein
MSHSYGVNVQVVAREETGKTNINPYSLLLLTLKINIMPSITVIVSDLPNI